MRALWHDAAKYEDIMARNKPAPTPEENFLKPLNELAIKSPEIDTLVFWANDGWPPEPSEDLDAEEAGFYAEGLLEEGFSLIWRLMAVAGENEPDHARIYVWEEGEAPPTEAPDWAVLAQSQWLKP